MSPTPDDLGLTPDQHRSLVALANDLAVRHPGPEGEDRRKEELYIAYRALRGDESVVDELAAEHDAAKLAVRKAVRRLRMAAPLMVEPSGPFTIVEYARRAGVTKGTVRRWVRRPARKTGTAGRNHLESDQEV